MGRPASTRKCPTCGQPGLKRNGTRNGKVRWRCTKCGATTSKRRPDITQEAQWNLFHTYISGKASQGATDGTATGRSLRRELAWCWNVPVPKPTATGEIYDRLFLDGTQIAYGWTFLIACNQVGQVVAWQWAASENSTAYEALISGLPPPRVVTVDGASGGLKAIKNLWGDQTRVQRCLIHVHRNNRTDLTNNPQTNAGKVLLGLSRRLLRIPTLEEASHWESLLNDFHNEYGNYLKERTLAKDDPETAPIRRRRWWYTHERNRRVYFRLARLARQGVLFTYLDAASDGTNLQPTTNIVESINSRINDLCYQHRGLSEPHLICAIQWLLYQLTETPKQIKTVLDLWNHTGRPPARIMPRKHQGRPQQIGPKQYDTSLSAEEGLYARKGWAGRWQP